MPCAVYWVCTTLRAVTRFFISSTLDTCARRRHTGGQTEPTRALWLPPAAANRCCITYRSQQSSDRGHHEAYQYWWQQHNPDQHAALQTPVRSHSGIGAEAVAGDEQVASKRDVPGLSTRPTRVSAPSMVVVPAPTHSAVKNRTP